jgi:cytochrome bd-type quinol oxidase subunit 2
MPRCPNRITQWSCVAITAVCLVPWALLVGTLVIRAIDSRQPLAMSLFAWIVLLVPLWVIMLAVVAWQKRDESERPAVLMALPLVAISALFFMLPLGAAEL